MGKVPGRYPVPLDFEETAEFVATMSRPAAPTGAVLPRLLAVLAVAFALALAPSGRAAAAQQSHAAPQNASGGNTAQTAQPAPTSAPPPAAPPQSSSGGGLTQAQLEQAIAALKDPKQRDTLIATLEAMKKSAAASPPQQQKSPAPATPVTGQQQKAAQAAAAAVHAAASGVLGAAGRIISHVGLMLGHVVRTLGRALHSATDVALIWHWIVFVATDVWLRGTVLRALGRLALVLSTALAAEYVAILALSKLRAAVVARAAAREAEAGAQTDTSGATGDMGAGEPTGSGAGASEAAGTADASAPSPASAVPHLTWQIVGRRLPYAALHLLISLVPIVVVALVGLFWLEAGPVSGRVTTLVVTAILNAYLACRGALELVRFVVAPVATSLRLVPMSDFRAVWLLRWLRRLVAVVAFGYAAVSTGSLFGLYPAARNVLLKLVSLVAHLIVAVMVIQLRRPVARLIRGSGDGSGLLGSLRAVMARTWHVLALFYVIALWIVWAIGVPDAFSTMLRVFLELAVVLAGAQALKFGLAQAIAGAFGEEASWKQVYPVLHARGQQFVPALRTVVEVVVSLVAILVLLQLWGVDVADWLTRTSDGRRVLGAVLTIGATTLLAFFAWEMSNMALEARIDRLARQGRPGRAARYRTLVPMLRTTLLVTILVVAGLVVLAAIGVNVTLLVGGLSIFGLAVGFGSQKLVQDIITGLFLLLEDAIQVGDWVTVGGVSGLVEKLSIRTIRLRGLDGSLNIIPFSSVTTVSNASREYGYAPVNIGVAYRENIDRVFELIEDEFTKMRADSAWTTSISGDLELWGLDGFGSSSLDIVGRIRCPAGKQWAVKREFNRRLKIRFDAEGVEIPFPYQRLTIDPEEFRKAFGAPRAGSSAPPGTAQDADEAAPTRREAHG